jgi:hypothetical protein
MIYLLTSEPATKLPEKSTDEIHLFIQFYIDANPKRQDEIRACLYKNLENPFVSKVHLLNERLYTPKELGVKSAKIVQTVIGSRLKYGDVFRYIMVNHIQGYIIIVNSDILFDATLENLFYSDISVSKKMFAQLRYEYNPIDPTISRIFGPRYDSQDTWIFHSNFILTERQTKLLDFALGKPGCDNKLIYILSILGYTVINDPAFIRTLHYHISQQRNYTAKDIIPPSYGLIIPYGYTFLNLAVGVGKLHEFYLDISTMPKFSDNDTMYNYILSKIDENQSFIIPRVAGFENDFAYIGDVWAKTGNITDNSVSFLKERLYAFANNAGIFVRNQTEIMEYARKYQSAFEHCELYTGWEPHGGYYRHIPLSHDYITTTYANKQLVWTTALNIFYYIYSNPWTRALRGKRILIVSAFADSIMEKIPFREKIYDGVDLFPECTFIAIRPPQTQGDYYKGAGTNEYFGDHLTKFTSELDKIRDMYDVALVSCGGYGNLVCNHIFESGKSAIYVGGVLQMYFGIMGSRWLKDEPDVVRLFLNEYWTRPKEQERPSGYKLVENGCYW